MLTRRNLILAGLATPFAAAAQSQPLTCGKVTERQTAGPYFKPSSPERGNLLEKSANAPALVI